MRKLILSLFLLAHVFVNLVSAENLPLPDDIRAMLDPKDEQQLIAQKTIDGDQYYFIKSFDEESVGYALVATENHKNKLLSFGEVIWPIDKTQVKPAGYQFFLETIVNREISNYPGGVTELNQVLKNYDNPYVKFGEDYQNLMREKGVNLPK